MRSFLRRLSLATLGALVPLAAHAGAPNTALIPPAPLQGPPTRVGCLSIVSGKIWVGVAGVPGWSAAGPNWPVAAGEVLHTDAQSRAEIEIGPHTLALAQESEMRIVGLDRQLIQLAMPQGRLYLHLRHLVADETVEIAMSRGGVWLSGPGEYDIDAGDQNQPARVAVIAGRARFAGGGADVTIAPGQIAVLAGAKPVAATFGKAATDAFDTGSRAQDYRQAKLVALYYISPEMTGYAALDGHGRWRNSSEYGWVWEPEGLPANWAPFRYGHWQQIAPWGWTWIDDQPWGFAPSHYGRWAFLDNRWGWVPGDFVDDPAYVPASVAFLGTPGVGLSVADSSTPAIGWFPLAPGEVYGPSYSKSLDYVRKLNRGDVADTAAIAPNADGDPPIEVVIGEFENRRMASVIPRPDFIAGHPVAPALLQLPAERLVDAPVITGSPRLGPTPALRPEVSAERAGRGTASATQRKPGRLAENRKPERKPIEPRRVAERHATGSRRPVRSERPVYVAHMRAPAYAGRALRSHRLAAYHPVHVVRHAHR
jgi:hypothetical protein